MRRFGRSGGMWRRWALAVALATAAVACGGGDDGDDDASPADEEQAPAGDVEENDDQPPANDDGDNGSDGAEDFDQDGFSDGRDNCPRIFNDDQLDTDGDGIGDRCDEFAMLPRECGAFDEVNTFASTITGSDGGDTERQPVCMMITSLPLVAENLPGLSVVEEGPNYVIIDATPAEIAVIEGLANENDLVIATVSAFPVVSVADLIARRLQLQPETALDTATVELLSQVDPSAFAAVPEGELAAQSDATIQAIPVEFWTDLASDSVIDAIGEDRLTTLLPDLLQLAPGLFPALGELAPAVSTDVGDTTGDG